MTYAALIQPVLWAITGGTSAFFAVKALRAWHKKPTPPTPEQLAAGAESVPDNRAKKSLRVAIIALLAAFLLVPAIGVVPAGYRGVVYRWDGGVDPTPRGEGVTLLVPWLQHLTTSSVRTQKVYSKTIFAQSRDLQEITVVGSVNYHVTPTKAAYLYQTVGPQYASIVIQPALFTRLKAAVGKIRAINFALNRDKLASTVAAQLTTQLSGYGITVEFVNIEDAIFDPGFVAAVKAKIIARQKAQEQQNLVAARLAVKKQTIIDAQAKARSILIVAEKQAEANRKVAASVTDVLLRWQYLDKWDGTLPTTLVGGSQNPSLFLNIP